MNDTSRRVRVRGRKEKKNGFGRLHIKDVTDTFREQVEFCERHDTTFRLGGRSFAKSRISEYYYYEYIQRCHDKLK